MTRWGSGRFPDLVLISGRQKLQEWLAELPDTLPRWGAESKLSWFRKTIKRQYFLHARLWSGTNNKREIRLSICRGAWVQWERRQKGGTRWHGKAQAQNEAFIFFSHNQRIWSLSWNSFYGMALEEDWERIKNSWGAVKNITYIRLSGEQSCSI